MRSPGHSGIPRAKESQWNRLKPHSFPVKTLKDGGQTLLGGARDADGEILNP